MFQPLSLSHRCGTESTNEQISLPLVVIRHYRFIETMYHKLAGGRPLGQLQNADLVDAGIPHVDLNTACSGQRRLMKANHIFGL